MLWLLLLQSTTTCLVNGQYVTCETQQQARQQPVDLTPLAKAPEDAADAVLESADRAKCMKMADRASKAGNHDAAAKILARCKAR